MDFGRKGSQRLIVEAKTTDAYCINLDKVVIMLEEVSLKGALAEPNVLLVVGREDTGDLEAQIRGSRHAWQVRLVSVESLIKLMFVREEVSEQTFTQKIRRILFPFEYTRVDNIIELVFETQREVEDKIVDTNDYCRRRRTRRDPRWYLAVHTNGRTRCKAECSSPTLLREIAV